MFDAKNARKEFKWVAAKEEKEEEVFFLERVGMRKGGSGVLWFTPFFFHVRGIGWACLGNPRFHLSLPLLAQPSLVMG